MFDGDQGTPPREGGIDLTTGNQPCEEVTNDSELKMYRK